MAGQIGIYLQDFNVCVNQYDLGIGLKSIVLRSWSIYEYFERIQSHPEDALAKRIRESENRISHDNKSTPKPLLAANARNPNKRNHCDSKRF